MNNKKAIRNNLVAFITKLQVVLSDGTKVRAKSQPMLMICMEGSEQIENGMFVMINDNRYNIVDKNNIQEYNMVVDLSLELVQNGRN